MKSRFRFWSRSGTGVAETFLRVSGSGFSVHLQPVGVVPLRPERRFHLEIVFVSPKTVSVCSRNTHFGKSEGIMLQWRFCFFYLSYIYQFVIRSFCFSLGLLPSLAAYAFFRAPCVIAANQKQWGKVFFSCLLGYVCSLPCTLCDYGKSEIARKLENVDFSGKLTKI